MIPGGYLTIGLGIALGVSALANVGLTRAYLSQRDDAIVAVADRDSARGAAQQCSDGVLSIKAAADKQAAEAEGRRKDAETVAMIANKRADDILSRPMKYPADECKSAVEATDEWLTNRSAK